MGTTCENLPPAHALLRLFNALTRLAAPSLLFKSEAIVHPDQVVQYIDPMECQLSYNPLQMALIWEAMATRDANFLSQALERRHNIANGCAWVNYVRSHDDIGCELQCNAVMDQYLTCRDVCQRGRAGTRQAWRQPPSVPQWLFRQPPSWLLRPRCSIPGQSQNRRLSNLGHDRFPGRTRVG